MTVLLVVVLTTVGLSGCGAPAYNYVADDAAGTYYKVPTQWHPIPQKQIDALLQSEGGSTAGVWSTAFDGGSGPNADHILAGNLSQPFAFAEVFTLNPTASNELSYNMLRDFMLPVTSSTRSTEAEEGFPLTDFKQLLDQTITGKQGVHGVREIFQYTFPGGAANTFDEDVLTNADQTEVYLLIVHCTNTCYTQNQNAINTVMTSFTVGSST
ncbi:MAG TPA: hypothetical protein VHZ33_10915 [Trebonia sp.]|nr:hypothetical protein [Trebonia sp.]